MGALAALPALAGAGGAAAATGGGLAAIGGLGGLGSALGGAGSVLSAFGNNGSAQVISQMHPTQLKAVLKMLNQSKGGVMQANLAALHGAKQQVPQLQKAYGDAQANLALGAETAKQGVLNQQQQGLAAQKQNAQSSGLGNFTSTQNQQKAIYGDTGMALAAIDNLIAQQSGALGIEKAQAVGQAQQNVGQIQQNSASDINQIIQQMTQAIGNTFHKDNYDALGNKKKTPKKKPGDALGQTLSGYQPSGYAGG